MVVVAAAVVVVVVVVLCTRWLCVIPPHTRTHTYTPRSILTHTGYCLCQPHSTPLSYVDVDAFERANTIKAKRGLPEDEEVFAELDSAPSRKATTTSPTGHDIPDEYVTPL